jgi:hypothetical protein
LTDKVSQGGICQQSPTQRFTLGALDHNSINSTCRIQHESIQTTLIPWTHFRSIGDPCSDIVVPVQNIKPNKTYEFILIQTEQLQRNQILADALSHHKRQQCVGLSVATTRPQEQLYTLAQVFNRRVCGDHTFLPQSLLPMVFNMLQGTKEVNPIGSLQHRRVCGNQYVEGHWIRFEHSQQSWQASSRVCPNNGAKASMQDNRAKLVSNLVRSNSNQLLGSSNHQSQCATSNQFLASSIRSLTSSTTISRPDSPDVRATLGTPATPTAHQPLALLVDPTSQCANLRDTDAETCANYDGRISPTVAIRQKTWHGNQHGTNALDKISHRNSHGSKRQNNGGFAIRDTKGEVLLVSSNTTHRIKNTSSNSRNSCTDSTHCNTSGHFVIRRFRSCAGSVRQESSTRQEVNVSSTTKGRCIRKGKEAQLKRKKLLKRL